MNKLKPAASSSGDLSRSSALIQGTLALIPGATVCYLSLVGRQIPGVLLVLIGAIIGFSLGPEKTQQE